MEFTDATVAMERFKAERDGSADSAILDELRALDELPDEHDPSWNEDETWLHAYRLVALAQHLAARRLEEGVGLVLDKMCFGDPGELMRGMRHFLEAAISPDWQRLAAICVGRSSSERAGTRLWAVDELGVLREPTAVKTIVKLFDDREREVALAAFRAATLVVEREPRVRPTVINALRALAQRRPEFREAQATIFDIQCAAPATGRINHPEIEAEIAREIRAHRDAKVDDWRSGGCWLKLEMLLMVCLGECEEWDEAAVTDGLVDVSASFATVNTLEVRGQMTTFKGPGFCVEPFEASVTIGDGGDSIESATIKYGDARTGLGAVEYGKGRMHPERVTAWLYVFEK